MALNIIKFITCCNVDDVLRYFVYFWAAAAAAVAAISDVGATVFQGTSSRETIEDVFRAKPFEISKRNDKKRRNKKFSVIDNIIDCQIYFILLLMSSWAIQQASFECWRAKD